MVGFLRFCNRGGWTCHDIMSAAYYITSMGEQTSMNTKSESIIKVEDKLSLIQRVLESGDYDVAVKESCTVFEMVFRKIFQQAVVSLPYKDREQLTEAEKKFGKGIKGIEDFGFGELVGLFRESRLLEKWSKYTARDLGLIMTLNYAEIVNLRNRITHQGAACSRGEANLVYEYLRNLLAVLGFADLDRSVNHSFHKEQTSETASSARNSVSGGEATPADPLSGLPFIRKSGQVRSAYSPTDANEKQRLAVQGENYKELDLEGFRQALEMLGDSVGREGAEGERRLLALDLGCAGGELTVDRFGSFSEFHHVIGIDRSGDKIRQANQAGYGAGYTFVEANVEEGNFEERLALEMEKHGRHQFDIIFSALTLHHLNNPLKALFKLRKLLRPGGCLILRGSDDGSKLAYPDEQNLVRHIIHMTQEVDGASDRENGRKLYHQLWKAGFRQIKMRYEVKDTAGKSMEERYALFQGSFSYRINNFRKRHLQDPNNKRFREEYDWMKDALEELEMEFANDSFFYQETVYLAIARQ